MSDIFVSRIVGCEMIAKVRAATKVVNETRLGKDEAHRHAQMVIAPA